MKIEYKAEDPTGHEIEVVELEEVNPLVRTLLANDNVRVVQLTLSDPLVLTWTKI